MPIKPENKARYPKDWKAIRAEILERAGDRCEWEENGERCPCLNAEWGIRDLEGKWWPWTEFAEGRVPDDIRFENDKRAIRMGFRLVLTIAHLNHTPEDNGEPGDRPNLRAFCQYHHLRYDHAHHMESGRKTRNAKKGQEAMPI